MDSSDCDDIYDSLSELSDKEYCLFVDLDEEDSEQYKDYKKPRRNVCKVPLDTKIKHIQVFMESGNTSLFTKDVVRKWIYKFKVQKKEGKLTESVISQLESLSGWTWDIQHCKYFGSRVKQYLEYIDQHKHYPNIVYCPSDKDLILWINKKCMLRRCGKLNPLQESVLEDVPQWRWKDVSNVEKTQQRVNYLRTYYDSFNKYPTRKQDRHALWIYKKRVQYKKGKLPYKEIKIIESLPNWTWDYKQIIRK